MIQRDPLSTARPLWLETFLHVVRRRPHRALAIAYWYVTRRRVRAGHRLRDAVTELFPLYRAWTLNTERAEAAALAAAGPAPSQAADPVFSLLLHAPGWSGANAFHRTLGSIRGQTDPGWEMIVTGPIPGGAAATDITYLPQAGADRATALAPALAAARGTFAIVVPPDALLPVTALARYREGAREAPDATILYGDEDRIDAAGGRSDPWFKPRWNPELILAQDYVARACAIRTGPARAAGIVPADMADCAGYALLLAVSAGGGGVAHIAHILCHLPAAARDDTPARLRAVAAFVAAAHAVVAPGRFGTLRVIWPLPDPPPTVTIIVPTRDRADLLEACIGSLLRETRYPRYDVLVVDNRSVEPRTHAWFASAVGDPRVTVVRDERPYNYSAINNAAAAQARGDYLCLLNNDTEVIDGGWLDALLRHAVRPGVGAVGAKLLYPDRTIQHAGVAIGLGNAAAHAHRGLADDQPGYFALAHSTHRVSAVTGACLLIERGKFAAVGGLDETHLSIAYNDVDLCLKLQRAGWFNIYVPEAVLIHHESKSRGLDLSQEHRARYLRELAVLQQRWDTQRVVDPMHHPRLDRASETYRIRF